MWAVWVCWCGDKQCVCGAVCVRAGHGPVCWCGDKMATKHNADSRKGVLAVRRHPPPLSQCLQADTTLPKFFPGKSAAPFTCHDTSTVPIPIFSRLRIRDTRPPFFPENFQTLPWLPIVRPPGSVVTQTFSLSTTPIVPTLLTVAADSPAARMKECGHDDGFSKSSSSSRIFCASVLKSSGVAPRMW